MLKGLFRVIFCVFFLGLFGCSIEKRMQSAKVSPFLTAEGAAPERNLENLPFDLAQVQRSFNANNYSKVLIAPVSTNYIDSDDWLNSMSVAITSQDQYKNEVNALATFAKQALSTAFADNAANRFRLIQTPEPNSLILELSLSEVTFGKPLTSAGALIAPVPGAAIIAGAAIDPSVAFEMRVRDPSTNQIVASVADRSFPTARIVNFNKLSASSACREVVENWSKLVVQSLNEGTLSKVSKPRFELLPW